MCVCACVRVCVCVCAYVGGNAIAINIASNVKSECDIEEKFDTFMIIPNLAKIKNTVAR